MKALYFQEEDFKVSSGHITSTLGFLINITNTNCRFQKVDGNSLRWSNYLQEG